MSLFRRFVICACILIFQSASRVSAELNPADYERADALFARTRDKVFKANVRMHVADKSHLWYRNDLANGFREFIVVDLDRKQRRPAFDTMKLAATLGKTLGKPIEG